MILMSGLFLFSQVLMVDSSRPRIPKNIVSLCAHMGKGYHTCSSPPQGRTVGTLDLVRSFCAVRGLEGLANTRSSLLPLPIRSGRKGSKNENQLQVY